MGQRFVVVLVLLVLAAGGFFAYQFLSEDEGGSGAEVPEKNTVVDFPPINKVDEKPKTEYRPAAGIDSNQPKERPVAADGPQNHLVGMVSDEVGRAVADVDLELIRLDSSEPARYGRFKIDVNEVTLATVKSGPGGHFDFEGLDQLPGALSLRAKKEGFVPIMKDHVGGGMTVDVQMSRGAKITGSVVDLDTKEPIVGARVEFNLKKSSSVMSKYSRWRHVTKTDGNGQFLVEGAPVGNVTLLLEHDDYEVTFFDDKSGLGVDSEKGGRFDLKMKRGLVMDALVIDEVTKKPVKEAEVMLKDFMPFLPSQREKTGALGKFKMKGVRRGNNEVTIRADGYTAHVERVTCDDKSLAGEIVFKIKPAGTAAGIVVDASGNPIAGAEIYVAEELQIFRRVRNLAETRSDAQGKFTVINLNDGVRYKICANAPGYTIGASTEFEAISANTVDGVVVQLEPGASIQGRVVDQVGVAIPNVTVSLEQPPFEPAWFPPPLTIGQKNTQVVVTDVNGVFRFEGLYGGRYGITPDQEDYQPVPAKVLMVTKDNESINQDFTMTIGHTISGRITDEFGAPAKDATVNASLGIGASQRISAKTDADGNYVIKRLREQSYRLIAETPDAVSQPLPDIPADTSNVDLIVYRYGRIVGRVVVQGAGTPVQNFTIRISPTRNVEKKEGRPNLEDPRAQKMIRSDEAFMEKTIASDDGSFTIDRVHPGDYMLEFSSPDYREAESNNVQVVGGQPTVLAPVLLPEGSRFEGRITDSQGLPVKAGELRIRIAAAPNSTVRTTIGPDGKPVRTAMASSWEGKEGTVGENGEFSIGGLPPGQVRVSFVSRVFCVPVAFDIAFGASGITRRDYTLRRGARVVIDVKDENGDQVTNASAEVFRADGAPATVDGNRVFGRSAAGGKVEVEKLEPGSYTIQVRRYGLETQSLRVDLAEGEEFVGTVTLPIQR